MVLFQVLLQQLITEFIPFERVSVDQTWYVPCRKSRAAAGWDLKSCMDVEIEKGGKTWIPTNAKLKADAPKNVFWQIQERSGNFLLRKFIPFQGIVDADYIGEIRVGVENTSGDHLSIAKGTTLAQIIPIWSPQQENPQAAERATEGGWRKAEGKFKDYCPLPVGMTYNDWAPIFIQKHEVSELKDTIKPMYLGILRKDANHFGVNFWAMPQHERIVYAYDFRVAVEAYKDEEHVKRMGHLVKQKYFWNDKPLIKNPIHAVFAAVLETMEPDKICEFYDQNDLVYIRSRETGKTISQLHIIQDNCEGYTDFSLD